MVRKKAKKKKPDQLTETELELMNLLWDRGEGTVRDVMAMLPRGRDLAYTSVSTILRILEQKKMLKTRKEGNTHIYVPVVSREAYQGKFLRRMVSTLFEGTPSALVAKLVQEEDLSQDELKRLRAILDERMKQ